MALPRDNDFTIRLQNNVACHINPGAKRRGDFARAVRTKRCVQRAIHIITDKGEIATRGADIVAHRNDLAIRLHNSLECTIQTRPNRREDLTRPSRSKRCVQRTVRSVTDQSKIIISGTS